MRVVIHAFVKCWVLCLCCNGWIASVLRFGAAEATLTPHSICKMFGSVSFVLVLNYGDLAQKLALGRCWTRQHLGQRETTRNLVKLGLTSAFAAAADAANCGG